MNAFLKTQSQQQKDIKARARTRENLERARSGEMFDAKPSHQVQAQIITLVGA